MNASGRDGNSHLNPKVSARAKPNREYDNCHIPISATLLETGANQLASDTAALMIRMHRHRRQTGYTSID
jgi:hypothetical protein